MILPMFVHEKDKNEPIASMPGVGRLSYDNGVIDFVSEARSYGVNQVVIFPKVQPSPAGIQKYSVVLLTIRRLQHTQAYASNARGTASLT